MASETLRAVRHQVFSPLDARAPHDWAASEVRLRESPYGSRFVVSETPWLREPLELIPDNAIEEIILMCCVQGGKTVSMQVAAAWALGVQPGPCMIAMHTDKAALEFSKSRMLPMLESCPAIRAAMPANKNERTFKQILFANGSLLIGAANDSFLRSHSIRWFFGDECSQWQPGKMEQARARTTRYWNRRRWFSSTPLEAGSDFHRAFLEGDQREWHLRCLGCDALINPNFDKVIKWEESETTKPKGEWNFAAMRETVRLECPHCKHSHAHTEENWREMNTRGQYVAMNPNAAKKKASFRFNALCLPPNVMSWADLAEQAIRARALEMKGDISALREFVTLRLAEPFDESKYASVTLPNVEEYDVNSEWKDEAYRFMTIDCQAFLARFYCVVRAWAKSGESRLLTFKEVHGFDELDAIRQEFKVERHRTFIDVGYEQPQVLAQALKYGWIALKGEDKDDYVHAVNGRRVKRPYSPMAKADPRIGKVQAGRSYVPYILWSNPSIKDTLARLKSGAGAKWSVCDLGNKAIDYAEQLDSERKREWPNKNGRMILKWKSFRANHAWDCECMQLVAASIVQIFSAEGDEPVLKKEETALTEVE